MKILNNCLGGLRDYDHDSLLAMKNLSIKQKNNLLISNALAVEIPASAPDLKAFVVVTAYKDSGDEDIGQVSLSKFSTDNKDALFCLRKYEVKSENDNSDYYINESDIYNSYYKDEIRTIEELEGEILKFIDDLSALDVEWNCDNPI